MFLEPINLYCERTGSGPWEEPLAVIASLAFLPAAWAMLLWSRKVPQLRLTALLTFLLCPAVAIGHIWPGKVMVVVSQSLVLALMLHYFYRISRDAMHLSPLVSALCVGMILPFAAISLMLIAVLPGATGSLSYASMLILILGYAAILRRDAPETARGLFIAALIMGFAMAARSSDLPLCGAWPYGTFFLWILGAATLLAQLGRVYHRHMLAGAAGGR